MSGAAKICGVNVSTISRGLAQTELEVAKVQTGGRLQAIARIPEDLLMELITKYNTSLLPVLAKAGLRAYLNTHRDETQFCIFNISIPQVCTLFGIPQKNVSRDFKALLGSDLVFLKAKDESQKQTYNALNLDQFLLLTKLLAT